MKKAILYTLLVLLCSTAQADPQTDTDLFLQDQQAQSLMELLYIATGEYSYVIQEQLATGNGTILGDFQRSIAVGPIDCDLEQYRCEFMFYGETDHKKIEVSGLLEVVAFAAVLENIPETIKVSTGEYLDLPSMTLGQQGEVIECRSSREDTHVATDFANFVCDSSVPNAE